MCFNGEALAREIFGSRIPVVTAIGHEIDWTLADYVSDLRLPTPTAVAGFLSPSKREVSLRVDAAFRRIVKTAAHRLWGFLARVESVFRSLRSRLARSCRAKLRSLGSLEQRLGAFDRGKILRQGYALVRRGGRVVTATTDLSPGDLLEIEILGRKLSASFLGMVKDV
jgi:exodeoxyribonuclease VII large subunit